MDDAWGEQCKAIPCMGGAAPRFQFSMFLFFFVYKRVWFLPYFFFLFFFSFDEIQLASRRAEANGLQCHAPIHTHQKEKKNRKDVKA